MLKKTLFSLAAVVGGVVAGCAAESAELQEPVVVAGAARCVDAAALLGVDLGNREILARPAHPGTYHLFQPNPESFTPEVVKGVHLDLVQVEPVGFATMEIHGAHLHVDQGDPVAFSPHPRVKGELGPLGPVAFELKSTIKGYHLDWAADLGIFAVITEGRDRSSIRLFAPEITGGADFDTLDPGGVTGLRICWGHR